MEEKELEPVVEETTVEEPEEKDVVLEEIKPEDTVKAKGRNNQEVNIRELRNAKERAERERAQLAERLAHYEHKQEPVEPSYGDDDFVEGKHLKREIESIRNQLKNYESQSIQQTDEIKLKSKYSDFDQVVNSETLERLKDEDPDFAEIIATSQGSLFSRGSSTYKRIKDMGIYVEDNHQQEKEVAQKNASKPKSVNSISPQRGDSPLSMANAFANGLTPELKQQLWKEMQESTKRH